MHFPDYCLVVRFYIRVLVLFHVAALKCLPVHPFSALISPILSLHFPKWGFHSDCAFSLSLPTYTFLNIVWKTMEHMIMHAWFLRFVAGNMYCYKSFSRLL